MRIYGLIGYPLSHSFSQRYFTEKFEKEDIKDCTYLNFPIETINQLQKLLEKNPGLKGLNVTIPYKEVVLPFLHRQTELVIKTGACNCIRIDEGKLTGYNTDVIGFRESLQTLLKPWHTKALILGTGGAAKAIKFVLTELGIEAKNVSRKHAPDHFSYDDLTEEVIRKYALIINTTPLGMYPDTSAAPPLNYSFITGNHFLFDAIYNPVKTLFLQKGEERGAAILNGAEMLRIQAEKSWEIWTNVAKIQD